MSIGHGLSEYVPEFKSNKNNPVSGLSNCLVMSVSHALSEQKRSNKLCYQSQKQSMCQPTHAVHIGSGQGVRRPSLIIVFDLEKLVKTREHIFFDVQLCWDVISWSNKCVLGCLDHGLFRRDVHLPGSGCGYACNSFASAISCNWWLSGTYHQFLSLKTSAESIDKMI